MLAFTTANYLLHRSNVIIIMAPIKADITDTIAMVNAQPISPVASVTML